MGKRVQPLDPPGPGLRALLTVGGLAAYLVGGLWILLFLAVLLFGGLDWREDVANGMSFQGPVILGLATLGFFWFLPGRWLLDRAAGRTRPRIPPGSIDGA